MFTDLGIYLTVKCVRGDLWYWLPMSERTQLINSLIIRISVKIISDFKSIVQFRHPSEVGGLYWLCGLVLTLPLGDKGVPR